MQDWQIQRILADPDKYLDGTLRINACVSYDRNPGHRPYKEWSWEGDGWYEEGTLTSISESRWGPRCDLHLDGGGQAEGYGRGDVEIIDDRFEELLNRKSPAPSATTPPDPSTAASTAA